VNGDLRGAAAAGMLAGILAGWKRDANPGALDDMVESSAWYGRDAAALTLTFADGSTFVLTCRCVVGSGEAEDAATREGVTS
jgi:hypothetical protein